ncbi:MAG: SIR2 family protein [Pseudomonadota bacterium]
MLTDDQVAQVQRGMARGKYNLLIGAGVSRDSMTGAGTGVIGAEELRIRLCDLKGLNAGSSLSRAASYLSAKEVAEHLTAPFRNCKPGPTVLSITDWVWSQIFTLNIDDALENAYRESAGTRRQYAIPINYSRPYETFRQLNGVPIIHLHGFVQEPDTQYVFSTKDYGKALGDLCAWMHVLSQLIETEPFIISGTSLTEPDLEFYLSKRAAGAKLRARGPSFLIEPYPDAGTELDCERFGLTLVESNLSDFLSYLKEEIGESPDVSEIVTPSSKLEYRKAPDTFTEVAFYSDFDLVSEKISGSPEPDSDHSFFFGRPPTWSNIVNKVDVILKEQLRLKDPAYDWYAKPISSRILVGIGQPGAGKTTTLKRVAAELSDEFDNVFYLKSQDGLDTQSDIAFLDSLEKPSILCVDNIAERADNIQAILDGLSDTTKILVVGVERNYRQRHLESVFDDGQMDLVRLGFWTREERLRLIESFQTAGLVGQEEALKSPLSYVKVIEKAPAAEAVCMILNDFRPLRNIVASLWGDSNSDQRTAYLVAALAHFCQPQGVRFAIASAAAKHDDITRLVGDSESPLPLTEHADDHAFILPLNAVVASRLVEMTGKEMTHRLLDAFIGLGKALAPYVTRLTIVQQTAEARLAGRLFNVEDIVRPLLGDQWDTFFEEVKPTWKWNSRYWEQRALGMAVVDLPLAVQYGRHALAIEDHPFPKTTLAKLLFQQVIEQPGLAGPTEFDEAMNLCRDAFRLEKDDGRKPSKVPYFVFFGGVKSYFESGGCLSRRQRLLVDKACSDATTTFPRENSFFEFADYYKAKFADRQSTDERDPA